MSTQDRWLLPEGIDESLPPEAAQLEQYRRLILDLYRRWGYELVMPPPIEYLESLLTGAGADLDLQTFKLTDQLTGRLLGARADMTPQVARMDAHRLNREQPVRLCYIDTVLRTRPEGMTGSRAPLQVGAELFGHAGIDSDVEIIRLMLETLRTTGNTDVHVELGHVGIFRALAREAGLDSGQEADLFDRLQRKAAAEIDAWLAEQNLRPPLRNGLSALIELNGGDEVLAQARSVLQSAVATVHADLDYLQAVAETLRLHIPSIKLHFDLAELHGYRYHTGVVFAAFAPGRGQAVARGGRYDDIGRVFGRARPAVGFSTDLKTLTAGAAGVESQAEGIYAPAAEDNALHEQIRKLRAAGERVVCELAGQTVVDAHSMGCDRVLVRKGNQWIVKKVS